MEAELRLYIAAVINMRAWQREYFSAVERSDYQTYTRIRLKCKDAERIVDDLTVQLREKLNAVQQPQIF